MTLTGLQQFIDVSLDATRPILTEIQVHSDVQTLGTLVAQEVLEPSVETVTSIAEDTLRGEHAGSLITFAFAGAGRLIVCRRDSEAGIVCFDGGAASDPIPTDER